MGESAVCRLQGLRPRPLAYQKTSDFRLSDLRGRTYVNPKSYPSPASSIAISKKPSDFRLSDLVDFNYEILEFEIFLHHHQQQQQPTAKTINKEEQQQGPTTRTINKEEQQQGPTTRAKYDSKPQRPTSTTTDMVSVQHLATLNNLVAQVVVNHVIAGQDRIRSAKKKRKQGSSREGSRKGKAARERVR